MKPYVSYSNSNDSMDTDTALIPYPREIKSLPTWEVATKVTLYVIVMVVSLFGNSLIIYVVLRNRRMRTTTNYYMINLAVADLMVTVSCSWVHMVDDITEGWVLGYFFCKINSFSQVLSLVASVFTLALIAYDRFFGIVFALKAHMTERRARWSLLLIWLSSLAVALPILIYRRLFRWRWLNFDEIWCGDAWPEHAAFTTETNGTNSTDYQAVVQSRKYYYTFVSVCLFSLPCVVMILAYSVIIWRLGSSHAPGELSKQDVAVQRKVRRKIIVMLVVLIVTFAVCWLPYQVSILYSEHRTDTYGQMGDWFYKFKFFALFLAHSNSALNPLIYACFNENFRAGFRDIARSLRCKGRRRLNYNFEMTSQYNQTLITHDNRHSQSRYQN